jgi:hypothetical protein
VVFFFVSFFIPIFIINQIDMNIVFVNSDVSVRYFRAFMILRAREYDDGVLRKQLFLIIIMYPLFTPVRVYMLIRKN